MTHSTDRSIYSSCAIKASDSESSSSSSENPKLKIVEDEVALNSCNHTISNDKIEILEDITISVQPIVKIKCQFCEKKVDKLNYNQHIEDHDQTFFTCTRQGCVKKFKRKSSLRKHLYLHQGKFKYECNECKAHFIDLNKFQLHQTIKHNSQSPHNKFMCDEVDCKRSFATSEYLRRHRFTHSGKILKFSKFC